MFASGKDCVVGSAIDWMKLGETAVMPCIPRSVFPTLSNPMPFVFCDRTM